MDFSKVVPGKVLNSRSLGGGCIGRSFRVETDEGIFFVKIDAAPGTSLEATTEYLSQVEAWFLDQPEVAVRTSGDEGPNSAQEQNSDGHDANGSS